MGYAVVHMMKIGKGGVRGIQSHNQRERPPHTNPDIDKARTQHNYELLGSRLNYHREINNRIATFATATKTVRKDAIVLCNFIITSDEQTMKAMSPEQQKGFFEDSVMFFSERYGAENIVNATVHMDEQTPHLHLGFVPITNEGRLSAKTIFTKTELQSLQTDFAREVGQKYGLERGIEGSDRKHLSEQRFKMDRAVKREQQALDTASKAVESLVKARKALKGISDRLVPLKVEYEAKKAFLEGVAEFNELFVMYPDYAKVTEKGLVKKEKYVTVPAERWEEKHILASEVSAVRKMQAILEEQIAMLKKTRPAQQAQEMKARITSLEDDKRNLCSQVSQLRDRLRVQADQLMDRLGNYQQFMDRHPDVHRMFQEEQQEQDQHQNFDLER